MSTDRAVSAGAGAASRRRRVLGRVAFALALALVFVALPAASRAPPDQYEQFDLYATTIRDFYTKLEWDRGVGRGLTRAQSETFCAQRALAGGARWRIPTVKELLTIVEEEPHLKYEFGEYVQKTIDEEAFVTAPVDAAYWTQTPAPRNEGWAVSFSTGESVTLDPSQRANVRCVR